MTDFQYLARGIALAACADAAACQGDTTSKVLKVSHKFCPPKKFLFWEMPL